MLQVTGDSAKHFFQVKYFYKIMNKSSQIIGPYILVFSNQHGYPMNREAKQAPEQLFPFWTHLIEPEWFPQVCLSPLRKSSHADTNAPSITVRSVLPLDCTVLHILLLLPSHRVLLLRDQQQDALLWRESGTWPRGNHTEAGVGPENAGGDPKSATIPHPAGACQWGSRWGPGMYVSSIPGQNNICLLSLWDQEKRTASHRATFDQTTNSQYSDLCRSYAQPWGLIQEHLTFWSRVLDPGTTFKNLWNCRDSAKNLHNFYYCDERIGT